MNDARQVDVLLASDKYDDAVNYARNTMGMTKRAAAKFVFDRSLPIKVQIKGRMGPAKFQGVLVGLFVAVLSLLGCFAILVFLNMLTDGRAPDKDRFKHTLATMVGFFFASFIIPRHFYRKVVREGEMQVRAKLAEELQRDATT